MNESKTPEKTNSKLETLTSTFKKDGHHIYIWTVAANEYDIFVKSKNMLFNFSLFFLFLGYVANFHKPANKVVLLHVIENLGIQDMSKSCALTPSIYISKTYILHMDLLIKCW